MIVDSRDEQPNDSLDNFRTIGIAVITAMATTFATELASWAVDELKARLSREGDETK